MEYELFERDFIVRTLKVIDQYERHVMNDVPKQDQFEITLLINCLLGLLVLPNERCYESIPALPLNQLSDWGLSPDFILSWGTRRKDVKERHGNLLEIVHRLRNGVAHT